MRVLVVGGSCVGKTHFSRKVSKDYMIEFCDLDFIHFDKNFKMYAKDVRRNKLRDICSKNEWVASGILDYQIEECAKFATHMVYLKSPARYWLIYRYIKRAVKGERNFSSLFDMEMLNWILGYKSRIHNSEKSHLRIFNDFAGAKYILSSDDLFPQNTSHR